MPKIPDSLPVKVTVSKITLEVPKSFFEHYALRAAIFVGRKGRAAATRRTKWFTLADPDAVPSRVRQSVALPGSHLAGSRRASAVFEHEASGDQHLEEAPVEMVVLEYSGINNVVYEVDMKPLNIFDGDWVFDQKTTHPLAFFAKILCRPRPGVRFNAAKTEQESNLHEMLQMDQDEMESDDDDSDNFSNDQGEGGRQDADLEMSLSGIGLTGAQMAALSGEENTSEMVLNQLRRGLECKKRYLQFPKTIDMARIVNTKAKTADFCERLLCKTASLLGTTLSFTVTAELPREKLDKFEDKVKTKEDKEESKRREKEEKTLEKERKKEEKDEMKRREKEDKKAGKKKEEGYGADVTVVQNPAGNKNEFKTVEQPAPPTPDSAKKKKSGFSPLNLVKNIFTKEEKPAKETPFAVKLTTTPYPYLVMLYDFQLSKLVMDPVNYRAVHIRLGTDATSTEDFPRLLLDATKPSAQTQTTVTWYDGSVRDAVNFDFGRSRIFFGDKGIRNITGFETLRALQEHERQYKEAKKDLLEGSTSQRRESADGDLFREQLMNVGTCFHPIAFEPTKYSANSNQALATKFTRVTAQLVVATKVVGEVRLSDTEEKKAYVKKLKREQQQREKEEKERLKAEKEAEKAARKAEAKKNKKGAEEEQQEGEGEGEGEAAAGGEEQNMNSTTNTTTQPEEGNAPSKPKDSDEDSEEGAEPAAADAAAGAEGSSAAYEGGAADHLEASQSQAPSPDSEKKKKAKEKHEKELARLVPSQSPSFQLSTYVVNEDYLPEEGVQYRITFQTGEELTFRARRFFLPSLCSFGEEGGVREQSLGDFMTSSASK